MSVCLPAFLYASSSLPSLPLCLPPCALAPTRGGRLQFNVSFSLQVVTVVRDMELVAQRLAQLLAGTDPLSCPVLPPGTNLLSCPLSRYRLPVWY